MTSTEIAAVNSWPEYQGEAWADLVESAALAPGADLVPGDILVGVPFIITSVTFRPSGIFNLADGTFTVKGEKRYYASVELVTAPAADFDRALKRGRLAADCPVFPGEELVINEGGTGVYRSLVAAWEALGWITLPDGPANGEYGESRMDASPEKWTVNAKHVNHSVSASGDHTWRAPVRLYCKRGLRVSEYENDYTKEGHTRFIA